MSDTLPTAAEASESAATAAASDPATRSEEVDTFDLPDWLDDVNFNTAGLVPCIVQSATSGDVLMMAWMNRDALHRTIETRMTWFWSRSRGELWNKGATSGNLQHLRSIHLDCDGDTILALVDAAGDAACHRGTPTCFDPMDDTDRPLDTAPRTSASALWRRICQRQAQRPEGSYTVKLLDGGVDRAGKKVGEEATEVVIAAKNAIAGAGTEELAEESADLLYHLFVLWRAAGLRPEDALAALARRG